MGTRFAAFHPLFSVLYNLKLLHFKDFIPLGRVEADASARSAETTTTSEVAGT